MIGCPKCGSTQVTANKKGYGAGKALAGAVLTGGVGLLAGFIGSNNVQITCLACGKRFKTGEGRKVLIEHQTIVQHSSNVSQPYISSSVTGELNRIKCGVCETENFTNFTYCRNCGKTLSLSDERIHSDNTLPLFSCTSCKKLAPKDGKFCPHCKSANKPPSSGCAGIILLGITLSGMILYLIK